MKERPILFSAPMVRAILDGSKTQTRRIVKPQPLAGFLRDGDVSFDGFHPHEPIAQWSAEAVGGGAFKSEFKECPYGQPGDRLWVRETWAIASKATDLVKVYYGASEKQSHTEFHEYFPVDLAEGLQPTWPKYRPSIHMPRWASRILLEVTGVRVERLQDISEEDAWNEGVQDWMGKETPWKGHLAPVSVHAYATLWEQINGPGSWAANPWVWAIEFKRIDAGAMKQAA